MRVDPSVGHLDKEASKWPWKKTVFEKIKKKYWTNIEEIVKTNIQEIVKE